MKNSRYKLWTVWSQVYKILCVYNIQMERKMLKILKGIISCLEHSEWNVFLLYAFLSYFKFSIIDISLERKICTCSLLTPPPSAVEGWLRTGNTFLPRVGVLSGYAGPRTLCGNIFLHFRLLTVYFLVQLMHVCHILPGQSYCCICPLQTGDGVLHSVTWEGCEQTIIFHQPYW